MSYPGCPDLAFSTVSAANTRMLLMHLLASSTSISGRALFFAGDSPVDFLLAGIVNDLEIR